MRYTSRYDTTHTHAHTDMKENPLGFLLLLPASEGRAAVKRAVIKAIRVAFDFVGRKQRGVCAQRHAQMGECCCKCE
jgi:hypothetical protein